MDLDANAAPLSDWVILKLGVQGVTPFRLRVGVNSIGRHSASDLKIESTLVSRHHAEITVPETKIQSIEVKDLNSINGTYVNYTIYRAATTTLRQNDLIGFGAEYDEDDLSELPVYRLLYEPQQAKSSGLIDEIVISDDDDQTPDVKPVLPKLQPEKNAAHQILAIFGKADEVILNGMERINPVVCEAIKSTEKAEVIDLNSDEEVKNEVPNKIKTENETESMLPLKDSSPPPIEEKKIMSRSPNCFGETSRSEKNVEENGPTNAEGTDEDQMMFSQILFDEMKSEMIDQTSDSEHHCSDIDFDMDANKCSPDKSIISLIDDDSSNSNEDFDEALEQKVSNWSQLLFCSQIIPKSSPPRVFVSGKDDEQRFKPNRKESSIGSETTLIGNLFKPLGEKLGLFELTDGKGKSALLENDSDSSPVLKKKRKRMKGINILDSSDEEQSYYYHVKEPRNFKGRKLVEKEKDSKQSPTYAEKVSSTTLHTEKDEAKSEIPQKTQKSVVSINKQPSNTNAVRVIPPVISAQFMGKRKGIVSPLKHKAGSKLKKTDPKIKEFRKERLKRLTSVDSKVDDTASPSASSKRKHDDASKHELPKKSAKVKNTTKNRGAFLCEMQPLKTSDVSKKKINDTKLRTTSLQTSLDTVLSAGAEAKKCVQDVAKVIRQKAEETRVRNAPKKIRFSDIEKNSSSNTAQIASKSPPSGSNINSINAATAITPPLNSPAASANDTPLSGSKATEKKKKKVRFNDKPTIHYFDSLCDNLRKVDRKDLMPRLSYHHRRVMIRRNFPMVDKTDSILSLILEYSNEWLPGIPVPDSEQLAPMPIEFESFEHYKRVMLPLMKLEFVSNLEREYYANVKSIKPAQVTIDNIIPNKDRIMLVTKHTNGKGQSSLFAKRCDLVLVKIGELETRTFAYMYNSRRSERSGEKFNAQTIFLEILQNSVNESYLRSSKTVIIQPAIDNIQVTIGAYNAIHQLEMTPLCEMLLKPHLLLNTSAMGPELGNQRNIITAPQDKINDEQKRAIDNMFVKICLNKTETTPNISLVQGPPGTGKSKVVVSLALHLLYNMNEKFRNKKILVCAQSNCAIDNVALKLLEARWDIKDKSRRFQIVRFGILERMDPNVHIITLKKVVEFERLRNVNRTFNTNFENGDMWKKHLRNLTNELKTLKEHPSPDCDVRNKIQAIQKELDTLRTTFNNALNLEQEFIVCRKYMMSSNIVCATLSSCVKLFQYVDYFDVCIIDEATQCTEPWTLLPLKFGISSLVLVGDSQQLPATVLSMRAANFGLSRSLFTRIECSINDKPNVKDSPTENNVIFALRVQYRMHPEICKFPNNFFYKRALINGENTLQHTTPIVPYSVLNLEYEQNQTAGQGKISNHLEADFVVELLKALNECIPIIHNTYGVITPYAEHQRFLVDTINVAKLPHVTVNTIDSYQGQEKDVIIISYARTNGVGFLANCQRLNVAITRPKKCLILCGNFRNLQSVPAWRALLKDAQQRQLYHEIRPQDINNIKGKVIERIKIRR